MGWEAEVVVVVGVNKTSVINNRTFFGRRELAAGLVLSPQNRVVSGV